MHHRSLCLTIILLFSVNTTCLSKESGFLSFWMGVLRNPEQVGAIAPGSPFLAKEISKHIDTVGMQDSFEINQPVRILEAGGGCGALTADIEKRLAHIDKSYLLDVIEIDPDYCEVLVAKFSHNPNIHIHCADVSTWNPGYQYDVIISSLPFTSLPSDLVIRIVEQFKKLAKKEGFISYFEYILLADVKSAYLGVKELFVEEHPKKEFEKKVRILSDFRRDFGIESKHVLLNVMPAQIHHLKMY